MKDVDYEEVARQYNKSMFRKLYDGDYGLAKTFWSGFFIFNIGLGITLTPGPAIFSPNAFLAFVIIWFICIFGWYFGTIRAVKKCTGLKGWGILAMLYLVALLLRWTLLPFLLYF